MLSARREDVAEGAGRRARRRARSSSRRTWPSREPPPTWPSAPADRPAGGQRRAARQRAARRASAPEEIDRAITVNLTAPAQLARALVPGMRERDKGHLVFIGSLNGRVATAGSSLYSATKFGLRGLGRGPARGSARHRGGRERGLAELRLRRGHVRRDRREAAAGVGTVTPQEVAEAVAIAVEDDKPEVNVAPLALRLGARAAELAPGTTAAIQRRLGARKIADEMAARPVDTSAERGSVARERVLARGRSQLLALRGEVRVEACPPRGRAPRGRCATARACGPRRSPRPARRAACGRRSCRRGAAEGSRPSCGA